MIFYAASPQHAQEQAHKAMPVRQIPFNEYIQMQKLLQDLSFFTEDEIYNLVHANKAYAVELPDRSLHVHPDAFVSLLARTLERFFKLYVQNNPLLK